MGPIGTSYACTRLPSVYQSLDGAVPLTRTEDVRPVECRNNQSPVPYSRQSWRQPPNRVREVRTLLPVTAAPAPGAYARQRDSCAKGSVSRQLSVEPSITHIANRLLDLRVECLSLCTPRFRGCIEVLNRSSQIKSCINWVRARLGGAFP